ncbi:MAG: hypothetical protein JXR63_06055 [Spirochaetales bacterium]|nr:hypothetical protein [Spirochaetales bacterium]
MKRKSLIFFVFLLLISAKITYDVPPQDPYSVDISNLSVDPTSFYYVKSFDFMRSCAIEEYVLIYYQIVNNFSLYNSYFDLPTLSEFFKDFPEKPKVLEIKRGSVVQEYSNAIVYSYPDSEGATITVFDDGQYSIDFADGSSFVFSLTGYYYLDSSGSEVYAGSDEGQWYRVLVDGVKFEKNFESRAIYFDDMSILRIADGEKFQYQVSLDAEMITIFVDDDALSLNYQQSNGVTISLQDKILSLKYGSFLITLTDSHERSLARILQDESLSLMEYTFPSGVTLRNLAKLPAYSEISSQWVSVYRRRSFSGLDILYTEQSEGRVAQIDGAKVKQVYNHVLGQYRLPLFSKRLVIIPDSLEEYVKIAANTPGFKMNWLPAGYQYLGFIVLWPFSVPIFDSEDDQDFYYDTQIYPLLAHELSHLVLHSHVGFLTHIPTWLDEGLAVYMESTFASEDDYYVQEFRAASLSGELPELSSLVKLSLFEFPPREAAIRYAVSYLLVKKLLETHSVADLVEFAKKFTDEGTEYTLDYNFSKHDSEFLNLFGRSFDSLLDDVIEDFNL